MAGTLLDREEYVEQEYFFRVYRERLLEGVPSQEILQTIHEEILATTRLPMAIDFMRTEILHSGRICSAMERLGHYFTPFQTFVMTRCEDDESRFEQLTALQILELEARYRANDPRPAGLFVYQLECVARNRLGYTDGLRAIAEDPLYPEDWRRWILRMRSDLGTLELGDLIYRVSDHADARPRSLRPAAGKADDATSSALFGEQEGRIARANIGRDPLYLFAALQRHLGYPSVPRLKAAESEQKLPGFLEMRLQKIEQKLKVMEMETRGGIDLSRFYRKSDQPPDFSQHDLPGN